jgi:hypothetical protein
MIYMIYKDYFPDFRINIAENILDATTQQFFSKEGEHEPSVRKGVIEGKKAPIDYMYF